MSTRRDFIKKAVASGVGLHAAALPSFSRQGVGGGREKPTGLMDLSDIISQPPDIPFVPKRVARWFSTIEDLQWSQKSVRDRIKRDAASFAEAGIDTAMGGGFHIRFDFANYFNQLHGYFANVCEELHSYGIKFVDHYSCNHVQRPHNEEEFHKLHRNQRHHTLLFHDPIAARHAQYEGYYFQDLCELDIRNGNRGYAAQYQMEAFCHNNPSFLDMHRRYLERLLSEVPIDAIEVDDMCSYPGLTTCGCQFCRERFRRDYNREIPPFEEKSFWGNTDKPMLYWGNYENPAFRDFIRMKIESVTDHVKLVKQTIGNLPLFTCVSSTGPIVLNSISLNLESMAPYLDFFMLENVGINVNSVNWVGKDAEALQQKDIARCRGNAPAIALSSTIYETGGYLGWALSRFWGVANWSNLLNLRLVEDPPDALEMADVIQRWNKWEIKHSDIDYYNCEDLVEARLVSNSYCRDNGWRNDDGEEHWSFVRRWSTHLVQNNVGYRFVRSDELSDETALKGESTPLIFPAVASLSDSQYSAILHYLRSGGRAWIMPPFGVIDERGFARSGSLLDDLLSRVGKQVRVIDSSFSFNALSDLIKRGHFTPRLRQISGDKRWAARIRYWGDNFTIHFVNMAMKAVAHPTIRDIGGNEVLNDIESPIEDSVLVYEIESSLIPPGSYLLKSPELDENHREVKISSAKKGLSRIEMDMSNIRIYGVIQPNNLMNI